MSKIELGDVDTGTAVFIVIAVVLLAIALWPLAAWFCLNVVAGLGLSFWQLVGIGWFAGLTSGTAAS